MRDAIRWFKCKLKPPKNIRKKGEAAEDFPAPSDPDNSKQCNCSKDEKSNKDLSNGSGTPKKIKLAKKTPKLKGRKKQKKEIKEISESDVEGLSESEIEDEASENEEAAQVNFNEDDELINMSVGQHDEFFK